jgi:hypothetical protein
MSPGLWSSTAAKKKDSDQKSSSAMASRRWKNLYPTSTPPYRGAKLEGRGTWERREWFNEERLRGSTIYRRIG